MDKSEKMATSETTTTPETLNIGNYCVSFIDILGQRAAMRGEGLLPNFASEADEKSFKETLKKTVGSIASLQRHAEEMLAAIEPNSQSHLRASLSVGDQAKWDEMQVTKLTNQYWSDGLVSFCCLGDKAVRCHVNGVFHLLATAGALCLFGLAGKRPIRGAIEIAWGVELNLGQLYGPAVARAYELESEVAQYPRVVVGEETVKFLQLHQANKLHDPFSRVDQEMAEVCLGMIGRDFDGHFIVNYLGIEFQTAVSNTAHIYLYSKAKEFVLAQLAEHRNNRDTKLALRYARLLDYFDAHRPKA